MNGLGPIERTPFNPQTARDAAAGPTEGKICGLTEHIDRGKGWRKPPKRPAADIAEQWHRLMVRPDWIEHAACRGLDPAMFHTERTDAANVTAAAKAICQGCPVRTQCLAYAMNNHERWGIWGGTSEHERRQLRRTGA